MLNIAICDDDIRFLEMIAVEVKNILKKLKVKASICTFTNGTKLISAIEQYNPYYDIVFLDIDMPIIDGKEVARKLRVIDKRFKLIFITSFEQEVLNTLQYDISDFLPKNLIHERLFSIVNRVVAIVIEDSPQLQIFKVDISYDRRAMIKVPLHDIIFFESVNRKIYLHTKRQTYLLHGLKFADLITRYSRFGFLDTHRTCLVNIQYIFSIDELEVYLENGTVLPLSRRKRSQVLDKFFELICEVTEC